MEIGKVQPSIAQDSHSSTPPKKVTATHAGPFTTSSISTSSRLKNAWDWILSIPLSFWQWIKSIFRFFFGDAKQVEPVERVDDFILKGLSLKETVGILMKTVLKTQFDQGIDIENSSWKTALVVHFNEERTLIYSEKFNSIDGLIHEESKAVTEYIFKLRETRANHRDPNLEEKIGLHIFWIGKGFSTYHLFGNLSRGITGASSCKQTADTIGKFVEPYLSMQDKERLIHFLIS